MILNNSNYNNDNKKQKNSIYINLIINLLI